MISAIVPTYNERENIPVLLHLLAQLPLRLQVVIVDDKSPDGTADVVRQCQPHLPGLEVTLVEREGKQGLGSAYRAGLEHARGEFVILMDADLSHLPPYI
jgi:dolichol-phosphate mannosyltransferase